MSAAASPAETLPPEKSHTAFFRQSGWLMIANVAGGVLMWAVHLLSKKIPEAEYGVFGTLLAVIMVVPALPLQLVFAQQTAQALATHRERELAGMIRWMWLGTTVLWLVVAAVALLLQGWIVEQWKLGSAIGLYAVLPALLLSLWMPMFGGVLQGAQNFLWLGWSMILNAIGRSLIAALLVLFVVGNAVSLMAGVVAGMLFAGLIAIWQTAPFWRGPAAPFDWRSLLRQVLPLMIGFTAFQFLFTADTMFVKAYFPKDETAFYVSAGTLSRALMWLVMPLATVMFPRLVHSAAKDEKSNLMGLVLGGTAVLAVCGALGLWLLGPWVVKFVFKPSYVEVATRVLPWYAFAMVPIALTNVLLNDLLARGVYRVVWPLVALVIGYAFALTRFHGTLITVLQTLGLFGLAALGLCALFSWQAARQPSAGASAA
jgi:O-antigen/teichoic acid export membrane protein